MAAEHENQPPVREEEDFIEIDVKKGQWPFLKAMWARSQRGKLRLLVIVDCNARGDIIGQGQGIGVVDLSPKKARRLRDFLDRTLNELT